MESPGSFVDFAAVDPHSSPHLLAIEFGRYPTGSFQYREKLKVDESSGSWHPSIEDLIFMYSWDSNLILSCILYSPRQYEVVRALLFAAGVPSRAPSSALQAHRPSSHAFCALPIYRNSPCDSATFYKSHRSNNFVKRLRPQNLSNHRVVPPRSHHRFLHNYAVFISNYLNDHLPTSSLIKGT